MTIQIVDKMPHDVNEAIALYLDAGWGTSSDYEGKSAVWEKAFQNSHFITAYDDNHLVGMIRFLTDHAHDTMIVECLVLKKYQNQGVAKQMLDALKEQFAHTAIYIQTTPSSEAFFAQNGFKKHHLLGMSYYVKGGK